VAIVAPRVSVCGFCSSAVEALRGSGEFGGSIDGQYGFGTVSMGDVRDIPFRLRNTGKSPTPLTVLSLAGVDFAFVNPPAVPQSVAGAPRSILRTLRAQRPIIKRELHCRRRIGCLLRKGAFRRHGFSRRWQRRGTLLMADAVIDFGSAVRGSTITRQIIVANPSTSDKLSIRNVVALGAAFHLTRDPLPIVLAPGASPECSWISRP